MDYPALKAEIASDPRGRGFVGMTDAEVAADLNAANISRNRRVDSNELLGWAGEQQRYLKIINAISNTALPDDVRNVANIAADTVRRDDTGFNPDLPGHIAMVDALVAAGVWMAADKTSLLALATEQVSWASGWGRVTAADVARVR